MLSGRAPLRPSYAFSIEYRGRCATPVLLAVAKASSGPEVALTVGGLRTQHHRRAKERQRKGAPHFGSCGINCLGGAQTRREQEQMPASGSAVSNTVMGGRIWGYSSLQM